MSDGGRERASLGVEGWKSSQKWRAERSAVRSIAWLGRLACYVSVYVVMHAQQRHVQRTVLDTDE